MRSNPAYLKFQKGKYEFLNNIDPFKTLELSDIAQASFRDGRLVFSYQETTPPQDFRALPLGVVWQWIPRENLPAVSEVTKRLLAFCARWPEGLIAISPYRRSSQLVVGEVFLWAIKNHKGVLASGSEVRQAVEGALLRLAQADVSGARLECQETLRRIFETGDSDPRPYF